MCAELKIQACPEHQIHSLYIDDELPSPWKEKFETHLASCAECQTAIKRYKKLQTVMRGDFAAVTPEMEARVWNRLNGSLTGEAVMQSAWQERSRSFWRRSVSLPIPAAAAAAALFIIIGLFAIQGLGGPRDLRGSQAQNMGITLNIGSDAENILSASDLNDVLQYLSREDTSDFIIISLPETRSFSRAGEPALIRAADYSRSSSTR